MRVIYINLDRATARREKMERLLRDAGADFVRLSATDGRALTADDRARIDHRGRKAITPYPLSDNEIACWLSHERAIRMVADGDAPMAAVLEDDCELLPDFMETLNALEAMGQGRFDRVDLHRKFKRGEIFLPRQKVTERVTMGRLGRMHMGNIGYVITRDAARRFLAKNMPIAHAIDKAMLRYWVSGLDLYALNPPVVRTNDEGYSFIEETRAQDNKAPRPRYADAGALGWKIRRFVTKLKDSIAKRRAFKLWEREELL